MSITAAMVKELRERSGAGMMDCKKALVAAEGDIEKAIAEMRKAGQAKADKKADRVASEGVIVVRSNEAGDRSIMVEINSETDFVARDDTFNHFADEVASLALTHGVADVDQLSALTTQDGRSVEELRQATVTKIGENLKLRRITMMETTQGHIGAYVHGGRIGVLLEMTGGTAELAKDVAMHVAASNPAVVKREQVPQSLIDQEREIFTAQARESGKPDSIVEKMINGRITKFLDEVSLLGQPFIKDPSKKVSALLSEQHAEVQSFARMQVGEGIEKKENNFVDEVMAQVREG